MKSDKCDWGASIYDVRRIFGFFDPPMSAKSILFVRKFAAFLEPHHPPFLRTSYMEAPLVNVYTQF